MSKQLRKPLKWVGSAKHDLDPCRGVSGGVNPPLFGGEGAVPDRRSHEDIKDVFGHAIDVAQAGGKHQDAKVMTGFGSAGVLEIVEDYRSDTYRTVYAVTFAGWVYVLHCCQKKSKSSVKTPREDMDLIHARLEAAKRDFEAWQAKQGAQR